MEDFAEVYFTLALYYCFAWLDESVADVIIIDC